MTIFVIIPQPHENAAKLADAVTAAYKDAMFPIDAGHGWLVVSTNTAKEISDKLGITDGSNGAGVVFEMGGYFGRANRNMWEWIKIKLEAPKPNG